MSTALQETKNNMIESHVNTVIEVKDQRAYKRKKATLHLCLCVAYTILAVWIAIKFGIKSAYVITPMSSLWLFLTGCYANYERQVILCDKQILFWTTMTTFVRSAMEDEDLAPIRMLLYLEQLSKIAATSRDIKRQLMDLRVEIWKDISLKMSNPRRPQMQPAAIVT